MDNQKKNYLLIAAILGASICLRAPLTSVGPLVADIGNEMDASPTLLGLLTTLPVLVFGITSPFINLFGRRFGNYFCVMIGLLFILSGMLLRSAFGLQELFLGTVIMAVGIGVGNVLLPSIIKSSFPSGGGVMTGAYMTMQGIFAGIGAGLSLPLARKLGLGWRVTLLIWAVAAMTAFFLWLPQYREERINKVRSSFQLQRKSEKREKSVWCTSWAWYVTLFLGSQSLLFYSLSNWIPSMLEDRGISAEAISMIATWYQWSGVPTTFLAPILMQKMSNKKLLAAMIGLGYFSGIVALLFAGSSIPLLLLALTLASASGGANYSLSMAMIVLMSKDAREAGELSGMSQCAGYLLAASGPVVSGILYDYSGQWTATLLFYILVTIVLFVSGQLLMRHIPS